MSDAPDTRDPLRLGAIDADPAERTAWEAGGFEVSLGGLTSDDVTPAPGDPVRFPGDAIAHASGSRAPASNAHNWVSIGPRNVGGRILALVAEPGNPAVMYAAGASGGVFKSLDSGQSWFPLWQDIASLAVGALAVSPSAPQTVWAATGEVRTGGGEIIRGDGVYVSTDGGATWTSSGPPGTAPNLAFSFDAIAAHPTNPAICWAVGPAGVFRTTNGGGAWTQFAATAGTYFSDAAFSTDTANRPILYLARATSAAGEATMIRLDGALHGDPATPAANDAAVETALGAAGNLITVVPAPGVANPPMPGRAKLAIGASNRDVGYVLYADQANGSVFGVFRSTNARATPATGVNWTQLPAHADWPSERQGGYNLCIAVSPANSNHVALGLVDLYTSTTANQPLANVRWNLAMVWDNWAADRAHHADHHALLFVRRGAVVELWNGNDGGISMSTDWATGVSHPQRTQPVNPCLGFAPSRDTTLPLIAGATTWRKRTAGLVAAQMYDLSTSPTVPTMFGCGFQDNGVFVTDGGTSWRLVMGADGGFVAFDPDDPYRLIATWQGGIASVEYPGAADGAHPLPGHPVNTAVFPRVIGQGFRPEDGAVFVAETVHDPFDSGRVLTARWHRLYGLARGASGDQWAPEAAGTTLELLVPVAGGSATVQVLASAGARALGLRPQFVSDTATAHVVIPWSGPYTFAENDQLQLVVNGAPVNVTFRSNTQIRSVASASVTEVVNRINAVVGAALTAAHVLPARPRFVEIQTIATAPAAGPALSITLGGTALTTPPASRLGIAAGVYTAPAGARAVVRIPVAVGTQAGSVFPDVNPPAPPPPPPPPPPPVPLTLTVQVSGRPQRVITLNDTAGGTLADASSLRVGELVTALRTALATDGVRIEAVWQDMRVRVADPAGVTFGGNGLNALGMNPGAFGWQTTRLGPFNVAGVAAPVLQLTDSAGAVANINAAAFTNPAAVYADELLAVIVQAIAANGLVCTADLFPAPLAAGGSGTPSRHAGHATEIAFSPSRPNRVWVGTMDGRILASDDDGTTWRVIAAPAMTSQDRRVEAIAFHPTDQQVVYVGLAGERKDLTNWATDEHFLGTGPNDPGFLFRTTDGGSSFTHVGATVADTAAPPNLVSVNAIETNPARPDDVYVATNIGVFESTDRGRTWQPINEGLPNVWIRDLAFEPTTQMLRAGAWGRGVFERHVGDLPARDVQLYVRANELDMGVRRPAPRGPSVLSPAPARVTATSPDIKITRSAPAHLVAAAAVVDGVDADELVDHEPPTPGPADLFVQVHNRGAFPATGVRLVTMFADTGQGVPPLPELFWIDHALGPLAGAQGAWTVLDDHTFTDPGGVGADRVTSEMPRVRRAPVVLPPAIADFTSIGLLTIASSDEDPILAVDTDVERLVESELKVALRQDLTSHPDDDHRLFLRSTDGTQFSVAPAPGSSALQRLGWAAGVGPLTETLAGSEVFDLSPSGGDRGIRITTQPSAVNISVPTNPDFPSPAATPPWQIMLALNRELTEAGVAVLADVLNPGPGCTVRLTGNGGTQFGVRAGGTLDPILGLGPHAAGTFVAAATGANAGAYALPAAGPHTMNLQVIQQLDVRFTAADFADRRNATAREVRAVLNRAFAEARMPIRAEVPRVALRVQGSVTDVEGPEPTLGGAHLAELTAQGNASIPPANRAALFQLLPAFSTDTVQRAADNFLYLRVTNSGNVQAAASQTRLFALTIDPADGEVTTAQIGADVDLDVPAGGVATAEHQWNPGAVDAGTRVHVLAVANAAGRTIGVPATFADFAELHRFCATHPGVAYRTFEVAS